MCHPWSTSKKLISFIDWSNYGRHYKKKEKNTNWVITSVLAKANPTLAIESSTKRLLSLSLSKPCGQLWFPSHARVSRRLIPARAEKHIPGEEEEAIRNPNPNPQLVYVLKKFNRNNQSY